MFFKLYSSMTIKKNKIDEMHLRKAELITINEFFHYDGLSSTFIMLMNIPQTVWL